MSVCRRFYGPRVVLAANQQAGSLVPVPTDNNLFLSGDPCPDTAADGGGSRFRVDLPAAVT